MTRYGRSPWTAWFPKSRVPSYPRLRGHANTDVIIVGGGLTGCATAYAFAAAGVKVALVEAGRIGGGSTASAAGWIADDPGAPFHATEQALGVRVARRAWQAWHRAGLDFATLLRRLEVKCHLDEHGAMTIAAGAAETAALKREQRARSAAGLDTPLLNARTATRETAVPSAAGIRARHGAVLDPYRACIGLAAAAVARGAQIFERSPVARIAFGDRAVDVRAAGATLRADRVIVATGVPTALFRPLVRHFSIRRTYSALTEPVPAKVRHRLGRRDLVLRDSADPPHIVRWVDEERILVTGADAPIGPDRQRAKLIVQRTGQLMYELSTLYPDISGILPEYGWDAVYARPADGLPHIGPHRNYPRHLFALGDSSRSVTGAYLASRILLRHYLDEVEPADESFAFTR